MNDLLFEIKPILTTIFLSPTLFLLILIFGLFLNYKFILLSRFIILTCLTFFWIFSTPFFSSWASRNLVDQFSEISGNDLVINEIQVIVVLGGGVEKGKSLSVQQLKSTALDRLRHGIELSRKTGIPLLVTGGNGWGSIDGSENEADVSKRVALEAFQFNINFVEAQSRDTSENAIYSYKMLSVLNLTKIALVTHHWHMPRSVKNFEKVGFVVLGAPMGYISEHSNFLKFIPNNNSLSINFIIFKEYIGNLIYF